jgi:hypothetical protein
MALPWQHQADSTSAERPDSSAAGAGDQVGRKAQAEADLLDR